MRDPAPAPSFYTMFLWTIAGAFVAIPAAVLLGIEWDNHWVVLAAFIIGSIGWGVLYAPRN